MKFGHIAVRGVCNVKTQWRTGNLQAKEKFSGESKSSNIMISDFQPRDLWGGKKILLFKSPSLWCFIMAYLENKYKSKRSSMADLKQAKGGEMSKLKDKASEIIQSEE